MIINFGKHKNKHISEIPEGYLKWGAENLSKDTLKKAFKLELQSRKEPKSKVGDGYDYINIYSKGKTKIGRILSNFSHTPFNHPEDGKFKSVDGYWYWLSCDDDKLRDLYGYKAKEYGRKAGGEDWLNNDEFKRKIKLAIKCKIEQNNIDLNETQNLPLKHYYMYGDKKVEPQDGKWIIEYIDELRNKPKSKEKTYNPLVFGKNNTENITSITIEDNGAHIYKQDGTSEIIDFKPYALSNKKYNQSEELKGNKYYKYINYVSLDKFKELQQEWDRTKWTPRSPEEAFMVLNGYTYYKGMTIEDVSVLSFDIEATGLNSNDPNAEVILISNTFRKDGKLTKKLFDIYNYDNQQDMLREWSVWVQKINPDIMLGHNILGYDLPYMANQDQQLLIGRDQEPIYFEEKVSKFRKDGNQSYEYNNARVHGRELIDTLFLSIKYDIGRTFPSYGLKYIEEHLDLVGEDRIKWDFEKYPTKDYKNWPKGKWREFCQYCRDDADSPLKMFDIMAPSFFYMTQSTPKTFQQVINEASGSQLDSIMVRSYLQDGYSQPKTSQKVPYQGAISMGNPGVYINVKKVDVASLYPSIMLQYEIYDKEKDENKHLVKILDYFRTERLKNKKLASKDKYYDDLQSSQKIFINSLYGFLGAGYLLYNYPEGAAKVTEHGREILQMGVEWATGHRLEKVVKKVINEGKENEEIKYHWVVGDKISEGRGYDLVNVDTDSFSVSNGKKSTKEEFDQEIKELNNIYPEHIIWEDDGTFDNVIVIKAKNYVLDDGKKIKYKGASITDQKKEPALKQFLNDIVDILLKHGEDYDKLVELYTDYCVHALNPKDIKDWCVKYTVSGKMMEGSTVAGQKAYDACLDAIEKNVIAGVQEGDKIWVYTAVDGEKQKQVNGEPVFLKDGTPKMVKNSILKFPQLYNQDHDSWHYVGRVYSTLKIFETILDMDKFIKYSNKTNQKKLLSYVKSN